MLTKRTQIQTERVSFNVQTSDSVEPADGSDYEAIVGADYRVEHMVREGLAKQPNV